jgi:hypothetical protein
MQSVFIAMKICCLGISMPAEGQCYMNIHGPIFGACAVSDTSEADVTNTEILYFIQLFCFLQYL